MSVEAVVYEGVVHNPVDVEQAIEAVKNRIAAGVGIVTEREKLARAARREFDLAYAMAYRDTPGPAHARGYEAAIATMDLREAVDEAEIAFRFAERTARALDKELFAWQSILNSVRAMYGAVGTGAGR